MKNVIGIKFETTTNELIQLISSTNDEQYNEIPFEGSWSFVQVGDHLLKSYGLVEVLKNGPVRKTEKLP